MAGRTINLFLIDGTPSGLRFAEIGLSTIKALVVPRASLTKFAKRHEATRTGVYMLIGPDDSDNSKQRLYVGEGDSIIKRIKDDHDAVKDFWTDAIILISKDENLTKSHVRYLEAKLIKLAIEAKRVILDNVKKPKIDGKLPEPAIGEMDEFVSQARLLIATLGFAMFQTSQIDNSELNTDSETVFEFSGKNFDAKMELDTQNGKFIVVAGSTARLEEAPSMSKSYKKLRAELIEEGKLEEKGDSYIFKENVEFIAITAAAQVVSGQSISGKIAWKTTSKKTYDEWEAESIASDTESNANTIDPNQVVE